MRAFALHIMVFVAALSSMKSPASDQAPSSNACGSEDQAVAALRSKLETFHVYPHIPSTCLYFEGGSRGKKIYAFTVRYNQGKCGGDSWSTLLDRFLVRSVNCEVLYYDVGEDEYLSFRRFVQGWGKR